MNYVKCSSFWSKQYIWNIRNALHYLFRSAGKKIQKVLACVCASACFLYKKGICDAMKEYLSASVSTPTVAALSTRGIGITFRKNRAFSCKNMEFGALVLKDLRINTKIGAHRLDPMSSQLGKEKAQNLSLACN